jgi:hypothetical protein
MQIKDLAHAVSMDETFIGKAIRCGNLTACMMRGSGLGRKMRYRITRSNALRWVWQNELGDRAMISLALAQQCPAMMQHITAASAPPELVPVPKARRAGFRVIKPAPAQADLFDSDSHLPLFAALAVSR